MKKRLICLITVMVFICTVLPACGSTEKPEQDQIVGNWNLTSITYGDSKMSKKDLKNYLKNTGAESTLTIVFNEDKTLKFTGLGKSVDPNGKWSLNEKTYSIQDGNQSLKGTINEDGNLDIVFPKDGSDELSVDLIMTFEKESK